MNPIRDGQSEIACRMWVTALQRSATKIFVNKIVESVQFFMRLFSIAYF
jgi:hypothetical protein